MHPSLAGKDFCSAFRLESRAGAGVQGERLPDGGILQLDRDQKKRLGRMAALSICCAALVILGRLGTYTSVINVGGLSFAYTDAFVMIPAGIGGFGCGLGTFTLLFIAEFLRTSADPSIYTVSIYLLLVVMVALLSEKGWFRSARKALISCLLTTAALAFSWRMTFSVLPLTAEGNNIYHGVGYLQLILMAAPETMIASAAIWAWQWKNQRKDWKMSRLGGRVTLLALLEAVLLSTVAILTTNVFFENAQWETMLQLGLTMMCASVPIAYLLNLYILRHVVDPVNAMSRLMDDYFNTEETARARKLPDLGIHSGDEVEDLYRSLQKMVGDMSDHIEKIIEGEKRTAHLTRDFMLALAKAVDAKDHYTSGHSQRVAEYSKEIARRMGKSEAQQEEIYTMGLLHDIGKIGVPESIINKNGRLSDTEYAEIKQHPIKGYEILKNVEEMPTLANGARWHHERYDGKGYPDGLAGDQIPEEARIIGVADAYDAMTSNRAYSSIRPQEQVRAEIERCKGTQFDPAIADVMLQMIADDREYRMHE